MSGTEQEALRGLADRMERAAHIHEHDQHRPITSFDARQWAAMIRTLVEAAHRKDTP